MGVRYIPGTTNPAKPRKRLTVQQVEHQEQVTLFGLIRGYENQYTALQSIYAVPNQAAYLRSPYYTAEGMRKGAFDINIDVPQLDESGKTIWHGCRIEMKSISPVTGEKGRVSPEQKAMNERHIVNGYLCYYCLNYMQAWERIVRYLGLPEQIIKG